MKNMLKRLFCTHYFLEDGLVQGWPDPKTQHHCFYCGKKILRRRDNAPVNPIVETNQQYYERMVAQGKAHLVMSPAFGTYNDPHLVNRERDPS